MGRKKNMRNPVKKAVLERQEKSNVTMQTLINEGKIGEFDHLEERTEEYWKQHQEELEAQKRKKGKT